MDSGHASSSSPFLLLLPFFVFWVLLNIPPSFCSNGSYTNCSNQFNCGKISVGFPFWGSNRPEDCGYPELKLNCKNEIATLEIRNLMYRVLDVNADLEILRIAREDFMDDLCLKKFVDTALDSALFEYTDGYGNITLVYGCPHSYAPIPGKFTCTIDGVLSDGYMEIENLDLVKCKASVSVPISETHFGDILNTSKMESAIREGFEVKWKVDSAGCRNCTNSRGVCGFDRSLNLTNCFCQNQSLGSKTCSSSPAATVQVPVTPAKVFSAETSAR